MTHAGRKNCLVLILGAESGRAVLAALTEHGWRWKRSSLRQRACARAG